MKSSKTIRINDFLIEQLENKSKTENRSLSNVVETICKDYFSPITRKEFTIDGFKYMPIHLKNKDIYGVVQWALSYSNPGNYCEVKVKKHHGSKGIAFCFDHFNIYENNEKSLNRRYTFSIDPNWEILDYFDHWTHDFVLVNDKLDKSYASEKININNRTEKLINIIKGNINQKKEPKFNKIFKSESWTKIYSSHESYYLENS